PAWAGERGRRAAAMPVARVRRFERITGNGLLSEKTKAHVRGAVVGDGSARGRAGGVGPSREALVDRSVSRCPAPRRARPGGRKKNEPPARAGGSWWRHYRRSGLGCQLDPGLLGPSA